MSADCLFCRIVAGEIPSDRVHDDDLVIAIRDIAPRAPTHILLMPKRHIRSAADLVESDGPLLGRLFAVAADLARAARHRRRRLSARLQRRSVGRPDGRPPPSSPDGWPVLRLASRMTARRRLAVVLPRGHGRGRPAAASRPNRRSRSRSPRSVRGRTVSPAINADARRARPRPRTAQPRAVRHAGAGPARRNRRSWPMRRGRCTRSCCRRTRRTATSSSTSFPTRGAAAAAAEEQAYLASGPGRVQTPQGTVTVIRQLGTSVILYSWLPGASTTIRHRGSSRRSKRRRGLPVPS